ncbi:MAG: PDZ domain-containing protein, partial [Deltaproteobacteria bacterium]|nr:PDZ domain-containing protein [Deltaproteobacteria bacterium]
AGVQKGDIILELNSQSIKDPHGLTRLVGNLKPGSEITIVVWRGSKVIELSTTLKKRDEEHVAGFGQDMDKNVETKDKLGLTIVDITPDIASKYSLKDAGGVLVIDIDSESSSVKSDIQRGDIIKEINRHEITDMRDYLAMLENVKKGQTVLLLIIRNSRPLYIAMDVD